MNINTFLQLLLKAYPACALLIDTYYING